MKVTYALLPDFAASRKPYVVKKIVRTFFSTDFHFHNECQLVYIVSGSGTRIIGESIERYEKGDLTFVGSNVPHVWYNESAPNDPKADAISVALYINPEAISEQLDELVDTKDLRDFFKASERGLSITGRKKELIKALLLKMTEQNNLVLLSSFLQVINLLLDSEGIIWLNNPSLLSVYSNQTHRRISKLMHFVQQNFREEITLEGAASVAGLQIHSFCRFFKALTRRTFSDFLNEVRIGFACQLLQQSDFPVTQVALESGYTNLSYFNRCFKKIKKITPRDYRSLQKK